MASERLIVVAPDGKGCSVFFGPDGFRLRLYHGLPAREAMLRAKQIGAVLSYCLERGHQIDPDWLVAMETEVLDA